MSELKTLTNEADLSPVEGSIHALIFAIGDNQFAIDITQCRDVNKNISLTEVPKAKSHIAGIVNIRGEIITVFEISNLLGYKNKNNDNAPVIIRAKYGNGDEGFRADRIVDITVLQKSKLKDPSTHLSELELQYIDKITLINEQLVLFIDVENLLNKLTPSTNE